MRPEVAAPRPQLRRGFEVRDLPDGCAVLDLAREAMHLLNPAAAFVLLLCDGTRTADDIAGELAAAVPTLTARGAADDVARALRELDAAGLLEHRT